MSTNKKILMTIFLCFVSSSLIFIIFMTNSTNDICSIEKQFYSQNWKDMPTNKIIILGSSHTGALNNDYINNNFKENQFNLTSFNLSFGADTPINRKWSVNNIIDMDPSLILYGLSWRDFEITNPVHQQRNIHSKILFDPESFFKNNFSLNFQNQICLSTLQSPLAVTLEFIRNMMFKNPELGIKNQFMPFFIHTNEYTIIHSDNELINHPILLKKYRGFDTSSNSASAIKEMILKFQENDIDVIIFTTPLTKHALKNIPENDQQEMKNFLKNLSENYDIKIFYLHDRYVDLNIWADPQHVAYNENSLIFSDDILTIILDAMN